jgi:hypothetical protein
VTCLTDCERLANAPHVEETWWIKSYEETSRDRRKTSKR